MNKPSSTQTCILIMAGGTGGHVFPGLATAEQLRNSGARVEWLGTQNGIEARLVPAADIPIHYIQVAGVRGKGIFKILLAPIQIFRAFIQALQVLRQVQPDCVLGMGGFVSGPGGLAAWFLRKPLLIHEQNAVAGTTNRILARFASKVMSAFPSAFDTQKQRFADKLLEPGNPVRESIAAFAQKEPHYPEQGETPLHCRQPLNLLVLGGSLGAKAINDLIPAALHQMRQDKRPKVWHQVGVKHLESVQARYDEYAVEARIDAFIDDMAEAYAWADLVVCRAGALTVSEIAAAGLTAIFVPYPYAIDDHQTANANWLVEHAAGVLIPQHQMDENTFLEQLEYFDVQRDELAKMAANARQLARPHAARAVADYCLEAAHAE